MKKLLAVVLALVMVLALAVPAMAYPSEATQLNQLKNGGPVSALTGDASDFDHMDCGYAVNVTGLDTTTEAYAFWHFVDTKKGVAEGGGIAYIKFTQYEYIVEVLMNGTNDFCVITPAGWTIEDAWTFTDGNFNLSHSGTFIPDDGGLETMVTIAKFIGEINNIPKVGEEFEFNIYDSDDNLVMRMTSEGGGIYTAEIDDTKPGDRYYIQETKADGYLPADPIWFTIAENGDAVFDVVDGETVDYIINLPEYGSLEVTDDVLEEYYKEYHKPVYKTITNNDTLVSEVRSVAGNLQANQTWNNGFTYVKIDVAAAKADGGVNVGIADSSKANKNKEGNTAIGYSYNVKIDEYNNVLISFDENLIYASVVARVLTGSAADKFDNAGNHQSVVTGGSVSAFNGWAPKGKNVETYYAVGNETEIVLFVHFGGLSYYETDSEGKRIVTGCELDLTKGPFRRTYTGDEEVYMVVTRPVYDEDIDGFVDETVYTGPLGKVDELVAGDYTVTVYVGAIKVATKTVAVVPSENTLVDFGALIIPDYTAAPEVICCQDTEWKCPTDCDCGC